MRMGKWFLAALIIGFASTPVWAQTCSTERVGGSLIKLQVHCDLTKGLTAEDVAFLAGNLEKPYRISANEVSEEAIDSAFYIAIALMIGSGVAQDVPTGAKLLADIAEQRAQFDAFDRPGQAFFTGLGFDLNVPLDTLRAVLLGAGPYATNQSFAALDRHFRRVEMSGQTAVLINLIRAINLNVDAATPADQRPGYRQLAALAPRAPEAARVLDSWTGSVSDTVLQADAANGNRDAIRRRAQGVIDGTLEVRSRNQALQYWTTLSQRSRRSMKHLNLLRFLPVRASLKKPIWQSDLAQVIQGSRISRGLSSWDIPTMASSCLNGPEARLQPIFRMPPTVDMSRRNCFLGKPPKAGASRMI